jgi:hypothetical protein
MVFIAEYLWGDDWPVAKRESNGRSGGPLTQAGEVWK